MLLNFLWCRENRSKGMQILQSFTDNIVIVNVKKFEYVIPCIYELNCWKLIWKINMSYVFFMFKTIPKQMPEILLPLTLVHSASQTIIRQFNNYYVPVIRTNLWDREFAKGCPSFGKTCHEKSRKWIDFRFLEDNF